MTNWLRLVRNGKGLRHLPIQYSDREKGVCVFLKGLSNGSIEVTHDHVPVSLRPLILGVRLDSSGNMPAQPKRLTLELHDAIESSRPLARIGLNRVGALPLSRGSLHLFETSGCRNRCSPLPTRWFRYALSWQHARHAAERQDGLRMSSSDLVCLNAYYIVARPVFLVSVRYDGLDNFFPMDLVGSVASGEFILALRATSPAIELMEGSKRLALCSAPAAHSQAIYALGAHHRRKSIDVKALPFQLSASPTFGLPIISGAEMVREVAIHEIHRIGSHVLFIGKIVEESGRAKEQLAHISGMYAEWLTRHHRAPHAAAV